MRVGLHIGSNRHDLLGAFSVVPYTALGQLPCAARTSEVRIQLLPFCVSLSGTQVLVSLSHFKRLAHHCKV